VAQPVDGSPARLPNQPSRRHRRPDATEAGRNIERPRSVEAIAWPDRVEVVGTERVVRQADRVHVDEVFPRERSESLNRAVNFTLAALGLLVLAPIFVIVAILVKVSSRGPIFYAQTRVGLDRRWRSTLALHERRLEDLGGRVFTIYKFRTMRTDAEKASGAVWAVENDPRVTAIGKFLRTWRLDEIPQLWNIVRGDMNIVGPRPERPSIVARLREDIPEYRFRHRVRPGLTGLAQINQKYDANLEDVRSKVNWDIRYLRRQGLGGDIMIMLKTVPSVLLKFRGW
jgi:lipopolysaccharide/colanic/teichoic acid biosynthesis glycosyltransferase